MKDKIISLIIGALLKIIDDNNDANLFDDNYIIFTKILLSTLTLYWINIDNNHCIDILIVCIVCYLVKQVDTLYYKIIMILIILNFIFKLKNINLDLYKYKIFAFIILFVIVYIESILFKEEYSKLKLYVRILAFLLTIFYTYIFTCHKYIIDYFFNNYISKNIIIKQNLYPHIDNILVVLGYIFVSILDINYMLITNYPK